MGGEAFSGGRRGCAAAGTNGAPPPRPPAGARLAAFMGDGGRARWVGRSSSGSAAGTGGLSATTSGSASAAAVFLAAEAAAAFVARPAPLRVDAAFFAADAFLAGAFDDASPRPPVASAGVGHLRGRPGST